MFDHIKKILSKKTLHEFGFVYFGALINGVSLFALNAILARHLTTDLFGIFTLAVLVLSTVAELSDFGLNAGLLRFVPFYLATEQLEKMKQLVKTVWVWRVSLSWALSIFCLLASSFLAKYVFGRAVIAPYIAFASLGIGGVILLGFVSTFLHAKQDFFRSATAQTLKGTLRLVMVIALVLLKVDNLFAYLAVYTFVPWILFFIYYKFLPENFRKIEIDIDSKKQLHTQLAQFSTWLTISSLLSIVASRVDQAMISNLLGLQEVAIFVVAYQLIQFYPLIYNSISSVMMPKVSALHNKVDLTNTVFKLAKWVLLVVLLLAIVIYPSQYIIILLFGTKYAAAMPVYLILAYSLLLNIISIPFSLIITVFNKTNLVAMSGVLQIIINVVFNFILLPRFGLMGAAYTFGIGLLVGLLYNVVCALFLFKKRDFRLA